MWVVADCRGGVADYRGRVCRGWCIVGSSSVCGSGLWERSCRERCIVASSGVCGSGVVVVYEQRIAMRVEDRRTDREKENNNNNNNNNNNQVISGVYGILQCVVCGTANERSLKRCVLSPFTVKIHYLLYGWVSLPVRYAPIRILIG